MLVMNPLDRVVGSADWENVIEAKGQSDFYDDTFDYTSLFDDYKSCGLTFQNSDGNIDDPQTKAATYRLASQLVQRFKERTGSTVCRELKGIDTGTILHSCPDCIMDGVETVQEILGL